MMKLENLELVDVVYDDKKVIMTFLDEERGEIREVNWNKKVWDKEKGEFVEDAEKEAKVHEWCEEYFGLTFDTLTQAIGERKDVYAYDSFNSLYPVAVTNKFELDDVGQILQCEIIGVEDDGIGIKIELEYDGKKYESKIKYADYIEAKKQWFSNPQKKVKQYEKFKQKFGVSYEEREELIGKSVMIEVKLAFNKFVFIDIKPLPKKK